MARPPTYHTDAEKPVTVSVRIPRALYAQAQQYVSMRRTTLTEVLLDGLRLRLVVLGRSMHTIGYMVS